MRLKSLGLASALALGIAAPLAAPAEAAPAHCYDMFGAAVGPSFDTTLPNQHWIGWVQAHGGTCRILEPGETAFFSAHPLGYPDEYLVTVRPSAPLSAPPTLSYQPPSSISVWLGDTARAAELVTFAYAERGRPVTMVSDTGRVIYRADGVWRIYDVTWRDGYRRQVAVQMKPNREYYAIEADDGESWSAAVFIGR